MDGSLAGTSRRSCIACASFALLTLTASAVAQGVKINEPLARVLDGEVERVQTSRDGQWAVFRAPADSGGTPFFSVSTKGGSPIVLAEGLVSSTFHISPDSAFVHILELPSRLHIAPIDGSRAPQLLVADAMRFAYAPGGERLLFSRASGIFAMPLTGGVPVQVTALPPSTAFASSGEFGISSDGHWVVFLATAQGRTELYSAATDGSTGPIRLNGDLVSFGTVRLFGIAPDGQRVVYRADEDVNNVDELYSAPIDGSSGSVKLNGPFTLHKGLAEWRFSRDGARVLYRADQDVDNVLELYSAPVLGGAPAVKLNATLVSGGDVGSFQTAAGGRVVYLADQTSDEVNELFIVGESGGTAVRLSHVLPPGSSVQVGFAMSADGRRAVYEASGISRALFSVPIGRPGAADRLVELASGQYVNFLGSPDSSRVAYVVNQSLVDSALFSVPIAGGPRTRLDDGGAVRTAFQFTADSQRVLYLADRDAEGIFELFSVASGGGAPPVKLNQPIDDGLVLNDVASFQFGALGTHGTFLVRLFSDSDENPEELHGVQLEPLATPVLLATGLIGYTRISADEQWVAYTIHSEGDEAEGLLYGVPMDGSSAPVLLNDPTTDAFGITYMRFGPEGRTLFYQQDGTGTGIYRVPVDGSAPRQELTGWGLGGDDSFPFEISPDGSRLVVLFDALVDGEYELFSLPSDGSATPVRLNDLTAPHGSAFYTFIITPDGQRVVYATDQETDQIVELFSVPIDGSAVPKKLSATPAAGTNIADITAAADRVVYRVGIGSTGRYELASAPVDGSAPAARLSPPLVAGGSVTAYRVAPGGAAVVFRADAEEDEVHELYVVPTGGSAPARKLHGPLAGGGDVSTAFEIDAFGARAVYLADQVEDEVFELFSAPLLTVADPLQITGPHVAGGDVTDFRMDPGGRQVVFRADHDANDVFELYAAPLDRPKEARRLSSPLVAGGDVRPGFAVDPSGRVVYIADQDVFTVQELYLSSLALARSRTSAPVPRASR